MFQDDVKKMAIHVFRLWRHFWRNCKTCFRRRPLLCNAPFLVGIVAIALGSMALLIWFTFLTILTRRLSPHFTSNGVQRILADWRNKSSSAPVWAKDFTRGVILVPCHSHNDYARAVPLYDAIAAGCTGVEADIWLSNLTGASDLLVGHTEKSLEKNRSLRNLYLDPLMEILIQQNRNSPMETSMPKMEAEQTVGVFDSSPNTSLILLIDFKTEGKATWPLLMEQLKSFRDKDWLTYWNGSAIVSRPLTIVGTGNAPFDLTIRLNSTHRDIFYDAPLANLTAEYDMSNSCYASASVRDALGKVKRPGLKSDQLRTMTQQIANAKKRGLKSRYWGIPSWPKSWRNQLWTTFTDDEIGMLNVDELIPASRWDWRCCIVGGIVLCS